MERLFVILFFIASVTAAILYRKFPGNTKKGIIVRFCWFIFFMPFSFIFLSENASISQNLTLGLISAAGLLYFFYKLKLLRKQTNH